MSTHPTFQFPNGKSVSRLGYGAMRLTGQPANFGPYANWEEGKRLLRRALELGVDFIDTARAYGPGWNERLIADALHPYPEGLLLATKGGVVKKSATERHLDGSPEGMRRDCEESLRNLKVDCIDLYQLHWVDPAVPFAESLRGLAALQAEGKIRSIGLCNVTGEQLQEAAAIAPIASVQNRYSVAETGSAPGGRRRCSGGGRQGTPRDDDAGGPQLVASSLPEHPADPRHHLIRAPRRKCRRCLPGPDRRPTPEAGRRVSCRAPGPRCR